VSSSWVGRNHKYQLLLLSYSRKCHLLDIAARVFWSKGTQHKHAHTKVHALPRPHVYQHNATASELWSRRNSFIAVEIKLRTPKRTSISGRAAASVWRCLLQLVCYIVASRVLKGVREESTSQMLAPTSTESELNAVRHGQVPGRWLALSDGLRSKLLSSFISI
jgi:hypothetical protein